MKRRAHSILCSAISDRGLCAPSSKIALATANGFVGMADPVSTPHLRSPVHGLTSACLFRQILFSRGFQGISAGICQPSLWNIKQRRRAENKIVCLNKEFSSRFLRLLAGMSCPHSLIRAEIVGRVQSQSRGSRDRVFLGKRLAERTGVRPGGLEPARVEQCGTFQSKPPPVHETEMTMAICKRSLLPQTVFPIGNDSDKHNR